MNTFEITDDDGDTLEWIPVGGYGQPMLSVFATDPHEEAGVNVTLPQARQLAAWLTQWADSHEEQK